MFGKLGASIAAAGRSVKHGLSTGFQKVLETKDKLGSVYDTAKGWIGKIAPIITPMIEAYVPGAGAMLNAGIAAADQFKGKADAIVDKAEEVVNKTGMLNPM